MNEASAAPGAVTLVTGGGTGVGRAIAEALAAAGHRVVITGRRVDVLDKAAAERPKAPEALGRLRGHE